LEVDVLFGLIYPTSQVIASEFWELEFEAVMSGVHSMGWCLGWGLVWWNWVGLFELEANGLMLSEVETGE